jgi:transcriptional regulator with XRE-family HTH domain
MEHTRILNVIGPLLRRVREAQGLTQDALAAKCQLLGLDVTRGTLAKIESRVRSVSDHEIPFLAKALNTSTESLFPKRLQPLQRKPRNPKGTSAKPK